MFHFTAVLAIVLVLTMSTVTMSQPPPDFYVRHTLDGLDNPLRIGQKIRRVGSMGWGPGGTPMSEVAGRYFECIEKVQRSGGDQGECSSLLLAKRFN